MASDSEGTMPFPVPVPSRRHLIRGNGVLPGFIPTLGKQAKPTFNSHRVGESKSA